MFDICIQQFDMHGSKQLSYSRVFMKVHGSGQKVSPKKTKISRTFFDAEFIRRLRLAVRHPEARGEGRAWSHSWNGTAQQWISSSSFSFKP